MLWVFFNSEKSYKNHNFLFTTHRSYVTWSDGSGYWTARICEKSSMCGESGRQCRSHGCGEHVDGKRWHDQLWNERQRGSCQTLFRRSFVVRFLFHMYIFIQILTWNLRVLNLSQVTTLCILHVSLSISDGSERYIRPPLIPFPPLPLSFLPSPRFPLSWLAVTLSGVFVSSSKRR